MYDVFEKSIAQLQADMEAGVTTSEEIVLGYLDRIAKLDKDGPAVNSVIEINPDAIFIARALDRELLSCDSLVRISHQPSPCQQLF